MNNLLQEILKKYNISQDELQQIVNKSNHQLRTILERYRYDLNLKYKYLNNSLDDNEKNYLLNVYDNFHLFENKELDNNLYKCPKIIPPKFFNKNLAKNITEFKDRFNNITNGQLKNIRWNKKIFVAGGIVNSAFTGNYESSVCSDVDIFIVGDITEEEFKNVVEDIYNCLPYNKIIYKTSTCINIIGHNPAKIIQIPLKLTKDLTQLLLFFDLDCAAIAYDGENLFALPKFFDTINNGYNILDIHKSTKKIYINRINKYYNRGYGFVITTLDETNISKVEIDILETKLQDKKLELLYDIHTISETSNTREIYECPEIMSYYVPKDAPKSIEDVDNMDNIYVDINKCLLGDIINYKWNDKTLLIKENIIRCYMCKKYIKYNKNSMCQDCYSFNMMKRAEKKNLEGQIAIVTGARVKIGYYTSLKLLRCGVKVIATTRFPVDALKRYCNEFDFENWKDRLIIYAIDFRFLPSVNKFVDYILLNFNKIDIIINNAAQTVKRPPEYYEHLIEDEKNIMSSMIVYENYCNTNTNNLLEFKTESTNLAPLSVILNQVYIGDEERIDKKYFPLNKYDNDGQQIDLRKENSWNAKISDLSTVELVEVQVINSIVPSILISKLKKLMINNEHNSKHIINVQSPEGQFSISKSSVHPHTNMAKSALNQLTQTIANEFIKENIYVNSVDVGWASSCLETFMDAPLTYEDSVARILDPIFTEKYYGKLLKDFKVCNW